MHPIIALWSHPRSMSTAMERIMRERGDLDCYHEPFMYDYYVHRAVRPMPHFDGEGAHPVAYEDIRAMLLQAAEAGPVFFKDMSYYVVDRLAEDAGFHRSLTNGFLIRDPKASILSYFAKDPEVTLEEIGLEAQARHYAALVEMGQRPVVIDSETVRADTGAAMRTFWAAVGLPAAEHALDWQEEVPEDWQQVEGWHDEVGTSKGIRPITDDELAQRERDFDALVAREPRAADYLAHHLPFYETLKAQALTV